jgi:hypothetical protein
MKALLSVPFARKFCISFLVKSTFGPFRRSLSTSISVNSLPKQINNVISLTYSRQISHRIIVTSQVSNACRPPILLGDTLELLWVQTTWYLHVHFFLLVSGCWACILVSRVLNRVYIDHRLGLSPRLMDLCIMLHRRSYCTDISLLGDATVHHDKTRVIAQSTALGPLLYFTMHAFQWGVVQGGGVCLLRLTQISHEVVLSEKTTLTRFGLLI